MKPITKELILSDTITFGKYSGDLLVEIIQDNPNYIRWCLENVEGFRISGMALAYLDEQPLFTERHSHDPRDDMDAFEYVGNYEPF